jgi:putative transposase
VKPHCEVINWCLMPNHYHFLIDATDSGAEIIKVGALHMSRFANGIRLLQSVYCQMFNRKYGRTGSLFKCKAKAKICEDITDNYRMIVFNYIHKNPEAAGLVKNAGDWPFSSYMDYFGDRNNTLCNMELAYKLIGIDDYIEKTSILEHFATDNMRRILSKNIKFKIGNHVLLDEIETTHESIDETSYFNSNNSEFSNYF